MLLVLNMNFIFLVGILIKGILCDWVSEWLAPLEYQYKDILTQNTRNRTSKSVPEGDDSEVIPLNPYLESHNVYAKNNIFKPISEDAGSKGLKIKLEETLKTAAALTATLKKQIKEIETRERLLKEAITNGRSGVTTLKVLTLRHPSRTYLIRDGFWTLCNGIVQYPGQASYNIFTELFSVPRCIGQEITSRRDPCVFNSIIKYQTIPMTRRSTYYDEDDYLCLRETFNNTLENFMSVTKKIVNETCKNGVIRSLTDNILDCGVRVLSEYTYYPQKDNTSILLPLEYCTEKDGSCKLIVAWHLSNKTIENFEFLKTDKNFKKFFINSDSYLEPLI